MVLATAYLVGEPLLLEVEAPGAGLQRGSPRAGCESSLHCDGFNMYAEGESQVLLPDSGLMQDDEEEMRMQKR
jgi:hypothetical protein